MPSPAYFVQFPHPGGQHAPGNANRYLWNTRPYHRRKFLCSPGRYVNADGSVNEGALVFWGEWEPPSNVVERWPAEAELPRCLHEPVWSHPRTTAVRQNTDPWVFGDSFLYSNCRQLTPRKRPSALQRLTPGSMVLFGSSLGGEFVVDTVFVVRDATSFRLGEADALDIDEAFRVCALDSLRTMGDPAYELTLFRGATLEAPVNGMFSFVPCRLAEGPSPRFARPSVDLPGYVNPESRQAPSGALRPLSAATVAELWADVRDQVLAAGCLLGVHFPTPPCDGGPAGV